ncbi:hypothetical protein [Bosea sp. (in: a-proteobacteria)]|uniref:hypothetical protein n=1 Tax=Bosea sp. (in: a-proteobacteria) TaxID=1871050 RepID=UPI001ACA538D|nr:hypothetical protein [Bosea sp. (in: a-proteobacteria)]MBN9437041.1 hypothetical protein [Bosea sp. (in: a-proteobacteria)]
MRTDNTMPAIAPATITKKQLWAHFVNLEIQRKLKIGDVECRDEMGGSFTPADLLHACGEFGELENLSEQVAEIVSDDDDPLWALESLINDIEGYASDARSVCVAFRSFARALETDDDVPEEETRYLRPVAAVDEQAEAA